MRTNERDGAPDEPDDASSGSSSPPDAFDSPWKDAIEQAFPEFLAFYFPAAHRGIDWVRGHTFLGTELRGILREADAGVRHADQLVQVHRKRGGPGWVYVHVEVQATRKADFERRMFTYSYRLFERFGQPVASLAVLADPHRRWRPGGYGFELFGSRLWLSFPTVKLLDYEGDIDALLTDPNPFALVTAAHLLTRRTRSRPRQRLAAKWKLVRLLYERDWDRERVIGLFKVLDWMMILPDALEDRLWHDIEDFEGKRDMPYITSVERIGL
ncbi:MAG: transposase, partial [Burkholderiaceae bacterium]